MALPAACGSACLASSAGRVVAGAGLRHHGAKRVTVAQVAGCPLGWLAVVVWCVLGKCQTAAPAPGVAVGVGGLAYLSRRHVIRTTSMCRLRCHAHLSIMLRPRLAVAVRRGRSVAFTEGSRERQKAHTTGAVMKHTPDPVAVGVCPVADQMGWWSLLTSMPCSCRCRYQRK